MSLEAIKNALLSVSQKVYRYTAPPNTQPPYIVWAEDGANDLFAGNRHAEQAFTGTIDLYTIEEDDPLMQAIPQTLNETGDAWFLNSVQFEEDTGTIHYEWVFETYG